MGAPHHASATGAEDSRRSNEKQQKKKQVNDQKGGRNVVNEEVTKKEGFGDLSAHVSIWSRAAFSSSWSKKDS